MESAIAGQKIKILTPKAKNENHPFSAHGFRYLFRGMLTNGAIRYFLPIPPIAVAAYIFVFNMFKYQSNYSPAKLNIAVEMLIATLVSGLFFFIFIAVLILVIMNFK